MSKKDLVKLANFYREGDSAFIALQDNDRNINHTIVIGDVDDLVIDFVKKYIEKEYSNFDGIQHDCIDFYRAKINEMLDDMERSLV